MGAGPAKPTKPKSAGQTAEDVGLGIASVGIIPLYKALLSAGEENKKKADALNDKAAALENPADAPPPAPSFADQAILGAGAFEVKKQKSKNGYESLFTSRPKPAPKPADANTAGFVFDSTKGILG